MYTVYPWKCSSKCSKCFEIVMFYGKDIKLRHHTMTRTKILHNFAFCTPSVYSTRLWMTSSLKYQTRSEWPKSLIHKLPVSLQARFPDFFEGLLLYARPQNITPLNETTFGGYISKQLSGIGLLTAHPTLKSKWPQGGRWRLLGGRWCCWCVWVCVSVVGYSVEKLLILPFYGPLWRTL